jgi:hypothetical protein
MLDIKMFSYDIKIQKIIKFEKPEIWVFFDFVTSFLECTIYLWIRVAYPVKTNKAFAFKSD